MLQKKEEETVNLQVGQKICAWNQTYGYAVFNWF